ncbi:MAG: lysozyme inhibitor LprI family protein [Acidithiobacillus sp.]
MIRRILLGIGFCAALGVSLSACAVDAPLNCPAIATKIPDAFAPTCSHPQTPLQKAICHYKPKHWTGNLLLLDSSLMHGYKQALRAAGVGTPECTHLLASQKVFEKKLEACGSDGDCVLETMTKRSFALRDIEEHQQAPLEAAALQHFAGGALFQSPNQKPAPLLQRIQRGMDIYPLPHMALPNGNTLVWGFQPHNATVQSLVVVNHQGAVRLLGAVDGIYLGLPKDKTRPELDANAHITLFVRDPQALAQNLPALRAWAAASILGFNVDCSGANATRCKAAEAIPVSIQAYRLNCPQKVPGKTLVNRCPLPLPSVSGNISPGLFWQ